MNVIISRLALSPIHTCGKTMQRSVSAWPATLTGIHLPFMSSVQMNNRTSQNIAKLYPTQARSHYLLAKICHSNIYARR